MFNKLKQFRDLRNQAKTLQDALAEEKVETEKMGIKMIMNGNQNIISLSIKPDLSIKFIEQNLPEIFNESVKKAQRIAAQKIQSMGGLGNLGL